MRKILTLLSLIFSGLIAGFFLAFAVDINPATADLSARAYVEVQQLINLKVRNLAFALVYFGALAVPAVLLAVDWRDRRSPGYWMVACGFVLYLLGVFLVTREINVPINNTMALWNPDDVPSHWYVLRDRWNQANLWRTAVALASFACYAWAFSSCPSLPPPGRDSRLQHQ